MNKAHMAYVKTLLDLQSTVSKDSDNPYFKSKYASLEAVQDIILEALHKHDATMAQHVTDAENGIHVITTVYHKDGEEKEFSPVFMPVAKNDAQGYGSAHTYGRRYALLPLFHLAPADDDGNAATRPVFKPDPGIIEQFKLCQSTAEAEATWNEIGKDENYKRLFAQTYTKLKD